MGKLMITVTVILSLVIQLLSTGCRIIWLLPFVAASSKIDFVDELPETWRREGAEEGTMLRTKSKIPEEIVDITEAEFPAYDAYNEGIRLKNHGAVNASVQAFHRAITLKPDLSMAWVNMGVALTELDLIEEAIDVYRVVEGMSTGRDEDRANAFCNHAHLLQDGVGLDYVKLEEARALFHRGLDLSPNSTGCLYNLGLGLEKAARYGEATSMYLRAAELDPSLGVAQLNLGNIAFRAGDINESFSRYQRALESPDTTTHLKRTSSFMLGQVYRHGLNDMRKALTMYRMADSLDPQHKDPKCCVLQTMRVLCLWKDWNHLEPEVAKILMEDVRRNKSPGSQSPYETRLIGGLSPSQHLALARLYSSPLKEIVPLTGTGGWAESGRGSLTGHILWGDFSRGGARKKQGGRLSVAYWSYDFRDHVMGNLVKGVICGHGQRGRIHTIAASFGHDDGSPVRQRLEVCVDVFLDAVTAGDERAAQALAKQGPEVLVDLMGHTTGARWPGIPALRPAPIVANYLGYPGTIGGQYTDYTIADKVVAPPELANVGFAEKLVYVPHSYQANAYNFSHPFCGGGLETKNSTSLRAGERAGARKGVSPKPGLDGGLKIGTRVKDFGKVDNVIRRKEGVHGQCQDEVRRRRGLNKVLEPWGGSGPVFCNYNSIHKMEPESFTVFMDILRRVPGSVMLLLASHGAISNGVEGNLRAEAAARGIHPSRVKLDDRLEISEHIERISGSCDLFLDSFVYGAHTTAADALWAGLPLLTLRGFGADDTPVGQMSGRVGTSLLSSVGLPELAVSGVKQFEDTASRLALSRNWLSALRKRLISASMNRPLFDTHLSTLNLESAYEAMWEVRAQGLGTMHIGEGYLSLHILLLPSSTVIPLPFLLCPPHFLPHQTSVVDPAQSPEAGEKANIADGVSMETQAIAWIVAMEQEGGEDNAKMALAASGRVVAGNPLGADGLHLQGLAMHLLGRHSDAVNLVERAALLLSDQRRGRCGSVPDGRDGDMIWENLEVVQRGKVQAPLCAHAPILSFPYILGLSLVPCDLAALFGLLKTYARQGEPGLCVEAFLEHWGGVRPGNGGDEPCEGGVDWRGKRSGEEKTERATAWWVNTWKGNSSGEHGYGKSGTTVAVAAGCFVELGRMEEAARAWKLASQLDPENQEYPLREAACLDGAGHHVEALAHFWDVVQGLNKVWFRREGALMEKLPRPEWRKHNNQKVIAIYCHEYGNEWFPHWGPSSMGKGLGGSEESVVFISRELAQLGFWVEVYADPSEEDMGLDLGWSRGADVGERGIEGGGRVEDRGGGVVWYSFKAYDVSRPADIFVAWRYHISLALGQGSPHRYLWLQDNPGYAYPSQLASYLDGIFCLSKYHISMLSEPLRSMGKVVPNGIDPLFLADGENRPDVFVYGSSPSRGLEAVLRMWPRIRTGVPTATLEIYYGFSDSFNAWGRRHITRFDEWMSDMMLLLEQDGIDYRGMVDHHTLARAYARAGFILYPTAFPETGCVTLMKAQAMGAIPITSRFPNSTLPELASPWDMGPEPGLPLDASSPLDHPAWLERWASAVIEASKADSAGREATGGAGIVWERRQAMKAAARDRFLWGSTARIWEAEFARVGMAQ
ncbi:unnamed protein product [Discosporangium mesarthrocarpum]